MSPLHARAIYRMACRVLFRLIVAELDQAAFQPAVELTLRKSANGLPFKAYLQKLSFAEFLRLLVKNITFTKKLDRYCDLIVKYWDQVKGPSILHILKLGAVEDEKDEMTFTLVQIIRDHKVAKKSG